MCWAMPVYVCLLIPLNQPVSETESATSAGSANVVLTTVGASANELLISARLTLRTSMANGVVETAISKSFDENNQASATSRLQKFLDGKAQPKIQWASFDDEGIQGAFVFSSNTILVKEELKGDQAKIEKVVLEEIGHWLEAGLAKDSAGDEGAVFAGVVSDDLESKDVKSDQIQLLIDGVVENAELAHEGEDFAIAEEDPWIAEEEPPDC